MDKQSQTVKIGLVQHRCNPNTMQNYFRAEKGIHAAAAQGAQIICTQELFHSIYFCQKEEHAYFQLAETIPGPLTSKLGVLAKELGVVLIASIFERRAAGIYHNTAVVINADGSLLGKYRKMHIPDDPLFYEKFYFTPGDLGFQAWDTAFGRIGVCVCWDQWYPEAARLTALRGAQIVFYPTAIGWHPKEKEKFGSIQYSAWETMHRSHAIANGCYIAAPNRCGHEIVDNGDGIEFWGQSLICDPMGQVIGKGSMTQEEAVVVEVDLSLLEVQRTHWPFFRDRRIDAYGDITKRFIE